MTSLNIQIRKIVWDHPDPLDRHSALLEFATANNAPLDLVMAEAAEVVQEIADRQAEAQRRREEKPATTPSDQATATAADQPSFHLTDTGNAERFAYQHRQTVRYCWEWSRWLAWDGTRWNVESGALVRALAKLTVRTIYSEAGRAVKQEDAKALAKHAMRSESENARRAFITLAQSEDGIPIAPADLDKHPWLLNCRNGTIDLQTGELHSHNPAHLLTKRVEIDFDPMATAPQWLAFLNRIFDGDQDLIGFLQRALGYSLTSSTGEQCFFIPHGSGSNGKSTLLDVILSLLGEDYGIHCDAELLLAKHHETHTTERADLFGKRLVTVIETGDGRRLAENFIKQVTGGDRIRARKMRQDSFQFSPEFKLWLATNHRPEIRGTDYAIWRRIRLIPFDVVIPDHEKDPNLPAKLKAELPGILAWCVQGCLAWQQTGLQPPEKVTTATQIYKEDMDVLAAFLADCCVIDRYARVKAGDLYQVYVQWCEQSGERPEPQRKFGQRLTERGFERRRSTGSAHFWFGIGIAAGALSDASDPSYPNSGINTKKKPSYSADTQNKVTMGHLGHSDDTVTVTDRIQASSVGNVCKFREEGVTGVTHDTENFAPTAAPPEQPALLQALAHPNQPTATASQPAVAPPGAVTEPAAPPEQPPADCRNCRSYAVMAMSCGHYGRHVADPGEPLCNGHQFNPRENMPC